MKCFKKLLPIPIFLIAFVISSQLLLAQKLATTKEVAIK